MLTLLLCTLLAVAADPLDDSLDAMGLARQDITTPRALERDYKLVHRLPLLDQVMARPFSLPSFWRELADALHQTGSGVDAVHLALHTLEGPMPRPDPPAPVDCATLPPLVQIHFPEVDLDGAWQVPPTDALCGVVGALIPVLAHADRTSHAAWSAADLSALDTLEADALGYFFTADGYDFLTVSPERMTTLRAIAEGLRPVDLRALSGLAMDLVATAESLVDAPVAAGSGTIFDLQTDAGRIVVGGTGADHWTTPVEILVDLGGDDHYGSGLGAPATAGGFALLVDVAGNDTYASEDRPAQGNGTLGVGVLLDAAGDDRYLAGDQAQGSAFGGVGVLLDRAGNDTYQGTSLVQGAASFGLGVLVDGRGTDTWTSDGLSQGFGSTLGLGLLHDRGGDDRYHCGSWNTGERQLRLGNCQGGAVGVRPYPWRQDPAHYGGLGLLVDDGGNDTYDAKIHSQGGSYFLGLGALFDRAGDDHYVGHREHHQGGSMHLAAAILTDLAGDDTYAGHDSSQGSGNDRSVGWLIDHAGDDRYESAFGNSQAYSRKANSLSVLVDAVGDDRYTCGSSAEERCQGYAQLTSTPQDQSVVVFLDLAGDDSYDQPERGNTTRWALQPRVIGEDRPGDPFPAWDPWEPPDAEGPLAAFARAREAIPLTPEAFATWLAQGLAETTTSAARLEQLTLAATRGQLTPDHHTALVPWLDHPDAATRAEVTKLIGASPADLGPALIDRLAREPDSRVRRFLIESLGRRGEAAAAPALAAAVTGDADATCRREALAALAAVGGIEGREGLLVAALADASEPMRFAAAGALVGIGGHTEALWTLSTDPSPWVRRAAAEALMSVGDERGIPLMIGTMDFYSLDNSYYAWGHDIGNVLRTYTNVAFTRQVDGETKRDDLNQARWQAWWDSEGPGFEIDPILPAARLLARGDRLRSQKRDDEARAAYEAALVALPGYLLAQERLAP